MNILYIVPYAPTPIRNRSYNLIRNLVRRGHRLTLATLWESDRERGWLDELRAEGIEVMAARLAKPRAMFNVLRAAFSRRPLQALYCWQPELAAQIAERLDATATPFDVIHVEHLRGAQYGLDALSHFSSLPSHVSPPILWDSVDCISLLFEQAARRSRSPFGRWVTQFDLARTRRHEGYLAWQFQHVLVSSAADQTALDRLAQAHKDSRAGAAQNSPTGDRRPPISILPNGVDLDYFTPNLAGRSAATVVLTGKMSYHANVTAALHLVEDVMPRVWAVRPQVQVEIVGQAPATEVRALAERYGPRVLVTGFVPDVRPHLWSAAVAAAPIVYGAGSQFKVLEALACATPVVATPQAVAALAARDGEHLLVAGDAEAMAGHILRLLDDEPLRRRLGEAGRRYVTEQHNWTSISGILEEHYFELAGRAARRLN